MTFHNPEFLILLLVIPLAIYLKLRTGFFAEGKMKISSLNLVKKTHAKSSTFWFNLPFYVILISLALFIASLSRPVYQYKRFSHNMEGIEIVLAVDTSISMWFLDDETGAMESDGLGMINGRRVMFFSDSSGKLKRRIEIARKVISSFVEKRPTDKIGLVAFKRRAITLSPPTIKQKYIQSLIKRLNLSMIKYYDGTDIGDAIGTSILSLKHSKSRNKIIILITDGNDNQEQRPDSILTQIEAAKLAAKKKIRIYTIGMGGTGRVFAPPYLLESNLQPYEKYENNFYFIEYGSEQINEYPLRSISRITGGKFYRASNEEQLKKIYDDIDKLEKSKFSEQYMIENDEFYLYFLFPGFFLLVLALSAKYTIFRVFP
ncbi:MAG: VWA domain-containing protein [Spirochaetota bacterium]|nr:VWA domain-containing protein [Spirochaetota bacterium]